MSIFGDPDNKTRGDVPSLKENLMRARQPSVQRRKSPVSDVPPPVSAENISDDNRTRSVIQKDMTIKGSIDQGKNVEIHGLVEGEVKAEKVKVHNTGRLVGGLFTDNASIDGAIEGEVKVRHLIMISSSGSVKGDIEYGQLALEAGGELTAELRNVPSVISGDLELSVKSGQTVTITTEDLTAIDPDNDATELTYSVSRIRNGYLARTESPDNPIQSFTQADIEKNGVQFVHNGSGMIDAGFDVIVTDSEGASSGSAKTVLISIIN